MRLHPLPAIFTALIVAFSAHAQETRAVPRTQEEITLSYSPVVKKVSPAVVNIYSKRKVQVQSPLSPFMNDPVFRQFFGNRLQLEGQTRERVVSSLGSGVIIDENGMIVTSNHVIKDADEVKVALADRREFEAKVVRTDPATDLAFLQIKSAGRLPFVAMRDSDTLEVGDLVLALGNPFGVGQTVTSGIISALARSAKGASDFQFFIQTDAAINPGNSGGALVNMKGELIGINTAIYSTTGANNGIGFAIPSNMVRAVLSSELKEGSVVRPWLGVVLQPMTVELAESLGLDLPRGILVASVQKNSPAEKAGVREGDVILSMNGNEIESDRELQYRVATARVGETAELMILRKGREQPVSVVLESAKPAEIRTVKLKGDHPLAGAAAVTLTPEIVESLDIRNVPKEGAVIMDIPRGGILSGAIREGDIIRAVNGKPVTSAEQLDKLMQAGRGSWQLTIQRGRSVLTFNVQM